jgi:putative flippase GtrA
VNRIRHYILLFIDFFHPPFARWIDQQTFRYLACGGGNQLLNIFIYWFSLHMLLHELDSSILFIHGKSVTTIAVGADIASYIIASSITIPIGFILSKYVVFQESNLKGRIQLFRYAVLTATCFFLNYLFLKLFIDVLGFYPTPSQTLTIIVLAVFSYIVQRTFTFKIKSSPEDIAVSIDTFEE